MKLIVKCQNCNFENKAPHHVDNRIDYAKNYGDNFSLKCKNCGETNEYHVDDIKAVDYSFVELLKSRLIVFIILFIILFVIGFFLTGPIGGIVISTMFSLFSVLIVKKNNSSKNVVFNKHKLKGRVSGVGFKK